MNEKIVRFPDLKMKKQLEEEICIMEQMEDQLHEQPTRIIEGNIFDSSQMFKLKTAINQNKEDLKDENY
jgi:hypothetical protein